MFSTETKEARTLEVGRLVSSTADELPGERPRGSGEEAAFCSNMARRLRTPELMSAVLAAGVSSASGGVNVLRGEGEWPFDEVETAREMMWCVRQLRSRRPGHGFQRGASLTTIALETIQIVWERVYHATVDRLTVEKELCILPGLRLLAVNT